MAYTWIPFYKELAEKLLLYKNDRSQLVDWIKNDLNKVKTKSGGHSLISYLTNSDYFRKTNDIDPFSVFGIFNRNNQRGDLGRKELLLMFQDKFNLSSEIPTDFIGIPSIEILSNNNFCLRKGEVTINFLWSLFEKTIHNDNISNDFDFLMSNGVSFRDLSLFLYLIAPNKYLPLNDSNIKMLQMYNITFDANSFSFEVYNSIMTQLHELIKEGDFPFNSFTQITANVIELNKTDRIWMWRGNESTFNTNIIECGADTGGKMDFVSFTSRNEFVSKYQDIKGKNDYLTPAAYWDFINEAKKGDVVVVFGNSNGGHILYGWGKFVSECEFDNQKENPLSRDVKWCNYGLHNVIRETLTKNTRFFHSVDGISAANIKKLLNISIVKSPENSKDPINYSQRTIPVKSEKVGVINNNNPKQKYDKSVFLKDVFINDQGYERLENLLLRKKNLILQGAPGVGKTYAAKRLAYAIMGEKDENRIMQVQFHQNYSYEDFVMGYKPNKDGGFDLKPGKFYKFCKVAEIAREYKYFFIIDEINRGNLSKIFGELLMLIENDYRDKEIELSYNDEKFSVPVNVYIIGMMNTADRSLAMIDYALRRRFSFFEMKPGFETLQFKAYIAEKKDTKLDKLVNAIIDLNKLIERDDSLGSGFCIGHSYLCELGTEYNLESIVDYDIIPMLREYWFDNNERFNQEAQKLRSAIE